MKIVHLVNELVDNGNGIVNVVVDLACTQSRAGHQVTVVSRGGGFVPLVEANGARHRTLAFGSGAASARESRRALRTLFGEIDPDIVHAHTLTPTAIAFGVRAEDRARRRAPRYRLITTVHNEYQRGVILMGLADVTVSVSEAVDVRMRWRGIPSARRAVIPNGVIGSPRRRPDPGDDALDLGPAAIVAVGAVSHRKGADLVAEAFELVADRNADASLWFVGNPDWTEFVEATATSPHADRIHFVGMDPEPEKYLAGAAVMVLASRREPMGLVLVEARQAGVPIVATRVDGIPETLDGGAAGRLVALGDTEAMAAEIGRFLDSPELRAQYVEAGRRGLDRFTVEAMTDAYVDLYLDQVALGC